MILTIIGIAALGHLGADFFSQWDGLPNKPLKCNMCLSFWLGILPCIYMYDWSGPLVAACAAITSELIYRILNRL